MSKRKQKRKQGKSVEERLRFLGAHVDGFRSWLRLDLLLVTSKHNVQYMLDVERAIFFDYMDALGVSRYLPVVIYAKGAPDKAGYVAHRMETYQRQLEQPWLKEVRISGYGSVVSAHFTSRAARAAGRGVA